MNSTSPPSPGRDWRPARQLFYEIARAGLMGLLFLGLTACDKPTATPPVAAAVELEAVDLSARDLAVVTARTFRSGIRVAGTVNPAIRVEIKAQTSGQIESLVSDRGTVVTQSQVLATLDSRSARAQVESIKSQLAAAQRDFKAAEILYKGGAASEQTYVNARVSVDSATAQLTEAQQAVERATIRSPIDGVVSERSGSAGEAVSPGQRLFNVVNSENLECAASVLPADMGNVRIGETALLNLSAYSDLEVSGRVDRIDPIADVKSRRVGVYIKIPNTNHALVAGLFTTGTILTNENSTALEILAVPSNAIRTENGTTVVYAVDGERMSRRVVEIDPQGASDGMVAIKSGVTAGTRVILSTTQSLKDGTRIKIQTEN